MVGIFSMVSSSKAASVGAGGAIFAAVYSAIVSPDIVPVMGGIGIGVIGIGWSIYSAGRDRRVATLTSEIEMLQRIQRDLEMELDGCRAQRKALREDVENLSVQLARAKTEIAEHDSDTG